MLGRFKTDARTISTDRAAEVCFRDLGCEQMTRGSFRHEAAMLFMDNIPLSWMQSMMYKIGQKTMKKIRAR